MISMTGFGRAETDLPGSGRAVAEVRSVNHRFLEMEIRLPEGLQGYYEEGIRAMAAQAFARGQVKISVTVKGLREPGEVVFREQLARRYQKQLEALRQRLGLSGGVTLEMLIGLPQVVAVAERDGASAAAIRKPVEQAVLRALAAAAKMRRQEGARLEKTLRQRITLFEELTRRIRQRVPEAQTGFRERLAERIKTVLQQAGREIPTEEAVTREAALLVQSTDVNEELERIDSHLTALRSAVAGKAAGPAKRGEQVSSGRTLDFLAQELQREVNTLGTKLRDGAIGRWVVEFKGQIEKLREQAANIE